MGLMNSAKKKVAKCRHPLFSMQSKQSLSHAQTYLTTTSKLFYAKAHLSIQPFMKILNIKNK